MTDLPPLPWNRGRAVGQKRPFTQDAILAIAQEPETAKSFRDLCLFCVGIDSMLRGSDLVQLKVSDVVDTRKHPKSELTWHQQKTKQPVTATLSVYTQSTVSCHVASAQLNRNDYLFTPHRTDYQSPISTSTLRRLVKHWAFLIGLNPDDYSSHSLRRTKPAMLYARGVRPEVLRLLLGHQNLNSTQAYLGID